MDLDLYVGISGGAFVASLLASGVSPAEMYEQVTSRTRSPFGVTAAPLYRLGITEFLKRSARAPRVLKEALVTALTGEGGSLSDLALSLLARELYVVAVDLDRGESVAFGEEGHRNVPVSRAVQASAALPGLYRPVRIGKRDYVDGGVKKTAHINLAIRHGADLVICINPIVPILNRAAGGRFKGHLSNHGVTYVLDQALRIMLHGRMEYGLERYQAEHPEVDILLIEPGRDDIQMFAYNIMRYSARRVVAEHGYRSVRAFFRDHHRRYRRLLGRHQLHLKHPDRVPEAPPGDSYRSPIARSLAGSLEVLGSRLTPPAGRRRRAD
jgi:predicted acylesterase/phospholipase RssA